MYRLSGFKLLVRYEYSVVWMAEYNFGYEFRFVETGCLLKVWVWKCVLLLAYLTQNIKLPDLFVIHSLGSLLKLTELIGAEYKIQV